MAVHVWFHWLIRIKEGEMKKRMVFGLVLALVFLGMHTLAQEPAPSPEHKKLGFWIGTWKVEAEGKETPLWPAGKYNATLTAEWFEREFHVICRYKWTGAMGDYSGLEILGYDAGAGEYYDYSIDGYGSGMVFKGTPKDNIWTYVADMKSEGKPIKFRWTVKNESPGLISWKSEISIEGGPWILGGEAKATRLKD
jgi:hypothetical protein